MKGDVGRLDAFRDPHTERALLRCIQERAVRLGREARIMEVCGTHTMAIARMGLRPVLPPNIRLISGPGCPVCVTPSDFIDQAIWLARRPGVILTSFGDMPRVPGARESLAQARANGADVRVVYSPYDSLALARSHPEREVVFLGVGFETTAPAVGATVLQAQTEGAANWSVLDAFRTVPPALRALLDDPAQRIDGFLCPAHVSAIIGAAAYEPFARERGKPCVVAGFEPLDILYGLDGLLEQIEKGEARVDNRYERVVRTHGNPAAQDILRRVFVSRDAEWRGLGSIPLSGLTVSPALSAFSARARFSVPAFAPVEPKGCRCGEVLKGLAEPADCPLFGRACTPEKPVGPCMVSNEGSCAARARYGGMA